MFLHEFLAGNRAELVRRCSAKVIERSPDADTDGLKHGIEPLIGQLIRTLLLERADDPVQSRKVSGPAGGEVAASEIGDTAIEHGRELAVRGYSIDEVVHDYGDLCQAITALAFELDVGIAADEFQTLNRCLDNAIAVAVSEFAYQRGGDKPVADCADDSQRLAFFAHELRNYLTTATLAINIIKSGNVGLAGATGQILDRSLLGMRTLIDRSLAEFRIESGATVAPDVFSLHGLISELKVTASLEAAERRAAFVVADVDPKLALSGDRDLLLAAVGNLLQNAFKFTAPGTAVTLNAFSTGDRIHIDVGDCCGGLHPGDAEAMFQPFVQRGVDRSGVGVGLSIAQRSVEANQGTLGVRNVAGIGCVFTIDMPRHHDRKAVPEVDPDTASVV